MPSKIRQICLLSELTDRPTVHTAVCCCKTHCTYSCVLLQYNWMCYCNCCLITINTLCLFRITIMGWGGANLNRFFFFFLWRDPSFLRFSRSHTTTHHSRYDSSGRVISSSQRPLDLSRQAATGRSSAEIMGSNPTRGMDICLLWVSCVVR